MRQSSQLAPAQRILPFSTQAARSSETPKLRLQRAGPPETVAALDIGSSKITCVIAQAEDDLLKVCSLAIEPSRGVERGEVKDLDQVADAARAAVIRAQSEARMPCDRFFVGVAGKDSQGRNSRGSVMVAKENHVITDKHVRQALNAARNISLPSDRQIIDSVPQSFAVDNSAGIRNPTGMTGSRLDAEVYLATESVNCIRNIISCLKAVGCRHEGLLFEPFASAEAVLTEDEKDLGAVQIDIGEGTMDIAVYYAGGPRFTRVLPVGGGHIARDVAVGLGITLDAARELVHARGAAYESILDPHEAKQEFDVPAAEGGEACACSAGKLCFIIESRVGEMLEIARKEIRRAGLNGHGTRVVLTGGTALLKGIAKKAQQVFGTHARIGRPKIYTDHPELCDNPAYATAVGLLVYGVKMRRVVEKEQRHPVVSVAASSYKWLREFFF